MKNKFEKPLFTQHVFVCTIGKACSEVGGEEVCGALRKQVLERGLKGQIRINKAGCFDQCGHGPMAVVYSQGTWFAHIKPEDANRLIDAIVNDDDSQVQDLLYSGEGRIKT